MPEVSTWELLQEERQRFESAAAVRLGVTERSVRLLRDGDSYGTRMYLNLAWYYWLVAVGLLDAAADLPGNEHATVDSHGQPIQGNP